MDIINDREYGINSHTGGPRKTDDNFPEDYQPYVRDPNRVYKKREGISRSGRKYMFDDL